ncbi:hypothetical protein T484DRAFT_1898490 [Baffinella frigidus]|nr:hypothetical protein T484DRAFT_1898490 [Cryptophyta sp. CCMP2293]
MVEGDASCGVCVERWHLITATKKSTRRRAMRLARRVVLGAGMRAWKAGAEGRVVWRRAGEARARGWFAGVRWRRVEKGRRAAQVGWTMAQLEGMLGGWRKARLDTAQRDEALLVLSGKAQGLETRLHAAAARTAAVRHRAPLFTAITSWRYSAREARRSCRDAALISARRARRLLRAILRAWSGVTHTRRQTRTRVGHVVSGRGRRALFVALCSWRTHISSTTALQTAAAISSLEVALSSVAGALASGVDGAEGLVKRVTAAEAGAFLCGEGGCVLSVALRRSSREGKAEREKEGEQEARARLLEAVGQSGDPAAAVEIAGRAVAVARGRAEQRRRWMEANATRQLLRVFLLAWRRARFLSARVGAREAARDWARLHAALAERVRVLSGRVAVRGAARDWARLHAALAAWLRVGRTLDVEGAMGEAVAQERAGLRARLAEESSGEERARAEEEGRRGAALEVESERKSSAARKNSAARKRSSAA